MNRNLFLLFSLIFLAYQAQAQNTGDFAIAGQYVRWAEEAMDEGRWPEALIVLERGSDYANVSSDISYLLALARSHLGRPRISVLEALRFALATERWQNYSAQDARLLETETLIALKSYGEAMNVLTLVDENPQSARLRLLALRFAPGIDEFYRYTEEAMNRFPRDPGVVKVFLEFLMAEYERGANPNVREMDIMDLVRRRLPVLILEDGELAWMAAPFIGDNEEGRRLVSAYRTVYEPVPASIPVALDLGVIDERTALEELFSEQNRASGIDLALMDRTWDLLRHDAGRGLFRSYLSAFTGGITRDINGDGIPEALAYYANGMLTAYSYDGIQGGFPELIINFEAGSPRTAVLSLPPDASGSVMRLSVQWNEYPALMEAELEGERFFFRPFDFFYAPVQFLERGVPGLSFLFPERDPMSSVLTRRTLIAHSYRVERPSVEFSGAIEVVELNGSIPIRAREYLNGRLISETDFLRGRPLAQRVDLDLDGRLETYRRFRISSLASDGILAPPETLLDYQRDFIYVESDWYGDGNFIREYFD